MSSPRMQTTESQLKAALTAAKEKRRALDFRQADAALLSQQLAHQRAVDRVLRPAFAKAGVDVENLNKMAQENLNELRRIFQSHQAEAAKRGSVEMAAIRERYQQRTRALQKPLSLPFVTTTLEPIFTWQTSVASYKGSQIAPNDSWIKFLMQISQGSQGVDYSFVFLWENQSDGLAVVNVASSLVLNGYCAALVSQGFFSGDVAEVSLTANLTLLGLWQPNSQNPELPPPNPPYQQSQYNPLPGIYVQGVGIFGNPNHDFQAQIFSASSYDLSYDFFLIPPQSSAAFEVSLDVGLQFLSGGGNFGEIAEAVFADDKLGYEVMCPGLQLDLLTLPTTASNRAG